jgi:uncharacterized membrane protein YfcA
VIDLPDSTTLAAIVADRRFIAAAAVSALSGLVRGFAGFGSALIYMPLVAAVYDPRVAAVTLLLIDFVSSAPFTVPEFRRCTWREVLPIFLGALVAVPFGTWALLVVDPIILRWGIAILVLGLLAVLVSGWRYRGKPHPAATIGVGMFSGFGGGAVQIAGPAVIVYWLSGANSAITVRANIMVYFALTGAALIVAYWSQGLFTADVVLLAVLLGIPFLLAIGIGAYFFHGTSDQLYRRIAYVIIAAAALLSLPVLDGVLR